MRALYGFPVAHISGRNAGAIAARSSAVAGAGQIKSGGPGKPAPRSWLETLGAAQREARELWAGMTEAQREAWRPCYRWIRERRRGWLWGRRMDWVHNQVQAWRHRVGLPLSVDPPGTWSTGQSIIESVQSVGPGGGLVRLRLVSRFQGEEWARVLVQGSIPQASPQEVPGTGEWFPISGAWSSSARDLVHGSTDEDFSIWAWSVAPGQVWWCRSIVVSGGGVPCLSYTWRGVVG